MRSIDHSHDPVNVLNGLMRGDFGAFLRKAYPAVRGGEPVQWNWHLDAIAHQLDRVASGHCQRLLVTMPPRNLKSIAISIAWVAWMLGCNPRLNIVCVSYSNDLAAKLARDCMALMQQSWFLELFPKAIISAKRSASGDFEMTAGGGRLATSVTGTLTGRGGDIIVIDDPIKPEEANSDTTRDFVNHWFQSTLASRLNDKATGAIITVMQRLHQYDLAGTLIETGGWDQLSLPAFAIEDETIHLGRSRVHHRKAGEILHPARESRCVLDKQKSDMGSTAFAAQYQQQPFPMAGNLVKAAWLRTYPVPFDTSAGGRIVQSWDTATKGGSQNDWSVCITANVLRSEVRILDVFRKRLEFPDLKRAAIRLAQEYHVQALLIEDQGSGQQLIQTLRDEQPRGMPLPIPRRPEGDKIARMAGATGQIEGGQLLLPAEAPWLADFKAEILAFPSVRHDDQVDALSQLMNWVLRGNADLQPLGAAPIIMYEDDGGYTRWSDDGSDQPLGSAYLLDMDDPW